jgi:PAS domain S-box-containing protein
MNTNKGKKTKERKDLNSRNYNLISIAKEILEGNNIDINNIEEKEFQKLLYNLKVYHIELQMQNEDINKNQTGPFNSKNKYVDLYESSPISYFTLDKHGLIRETNLAGAKLIGLDKSVLIDKPIMAYIFPDDVRLFKQHLKEVLKGKGKDITQLRLNINDDINKYVRVESVLLKNHEEKPQILTAIIDLTIRKQAEEKAEENERKYKSLFDNMLNGFGYFKVVCNANNTPIDYICIEINDAFEVITGVNKRDVVGKNVSKTIPKNFGEDFDWIKNFGKVSIEGKSIRIESYSIFHKRWFSIYAYSPQKYYLAILLEDITRRKNIEENLKRSEERYRAVVEDQTELILRFRKDGIITFVNEACSRYFHKSRDELVNDTFLSYVKVEDRPKLTRSINSLTIEHPIFSIEHRLILSNGELRWTRWNYRAIYNDNRELIEYQAVGRDISRQKEAEEALIKSEENYRALLQSITDGVTVINKEWEIILVNDEILKMADKCCNGKQNDCIGTILGLDKKDILRIYEEVMENGKTRLLVNKIKLNDDTDLWIENRIYPVPEGIMCISTDITERKLAETALKESEYKYRTFIELANDAIFLAEADTGIIIEVNKQAEQLLKRPMDEIIGMHQSGLHYIDIKKEETKEFRKTIKGKKSKYTETEVIDSEGNVIPVEISGIAFNIKDKKYVLGIFRDIRERKEKEEQMREIYSELAVTNRKLSKVNLEVKRANNDLSYKNDELLRTNKELERLKNNLEAVVNNFPNGIIILFSKDLEIILARGTGLKKVELDHTLLEGKMLPDINNLDQSIIDKLANLFDKSIQGETSELEIRIKLFDYTIKVLPIRDVKQEIIGGLCILEDITNQKIITKELKEINHQLNQALRQVKESELKYKAVVEDQTELICRLNNNFEITFVNKAFQKYFNIDNIDELSNDYFIKIIPDEEIDMVSDSIKHLNYERPIQIIEHKMIINGNAKWCRWTYRAILDDNNNIIEYQAVGKDITDEKNAYLELEKSQKRFKAIFDNAIVGVNVVNKDGDYIQFNEKWAEMIGYTRDEVYKLNRFHITYDEDKPKCKNLMQLMLNKEIDSYHIEKRFVKKDGSIFWGELSASHIYDESDNVNIIIGIVTDITERKESEQTLKRTMDELKRSNEELENFAHTVSHDLKSPINVVISYINLIKRDYAEAIGKEGMELTDMVMERSHKMIGMIDNLLAYAQINLKGKTFTECNTNDIVLNALNNIEVDIIENEAKILYDKLPNVIADETQLISVFQNIISNSIKYKKEDKKPIINIYAEDKDDEWLFKVVDNGIGVEKDELDKIFNIFHRAKKARSISGYGIGLSSTKKIIERHGGKIWIESEVNKGTTVSFTIKKQTIL